MKITYSNTAYTQYLGVRHVGVWLVLCFENEVYCESDTDMTSLVINGVLSVAIGSKNNVIF